MKLTQVLSATITTLLLSASSFPAQAETLEDDFTTICGWYNSLATDAKYKSFTAKKKFTFVFDPKIQDGIKNMQLRSFYSALRTTQSTQRYEFLKSYAEGTLGKNWDCPSMQKIMDEFNALDPYFQYAK
jgi:hypothetical protein